MYYSLAKMTRQEDQEHIFEIYSAKGENFPSNYVAIQYRKTMMTSCLQREHIYKLK